MKKLFKILSATSVLIATSASLIDVQAESKADPRQGIIRRLNSFRMVFIDLPSTQDEIAERYNLYVPDPEEVEDAVVHPVTKPELNEEQAQHIKDYPKGEKVGNDPLTLVVSDYTYDYVNKRGEDIYDVKPEFISREGKETDEFNYLLDQNLVVGIGENKMQSFFGHYYDLTGSGIFNSLVDYDLLYEGAKVVVTDDLGYTKEYVITDIFEVMHQDQQKHFYGEDHLPTLAYYGNGEDLVYIQYCRWDISLGLLVVGVGHRTW